MGPAAAKPARHTNLTDVARRAGVSSMTVSRALRRPESVSDDTRRRVERAVAALGYVPNNIAGGLRSRRSRTIACVIPTIASPVFANVVQGLTDVLYGHDYRVVLGTSNYSEAEEQRVTAGLLAHRPEAVVLPAGDHRRELGRLLKRVGVPVVEIWERLENPVDMNVGFSNRDVGAAVVTHLVERGARRIAFVGMGADEHARARARREAYAETVVRLLDQKPIVFDAPFTIDGGRAALARILRDDPAIDAVFCVGDLPAVGVLLEAHEAGCAVPQRLMVAGFGDHEFGRQIRPGLTTVRVPERRIGQIAAEMIVGRLGDHDTGPRAIDVGFEVIPRDSTARTQADDSG